MEVILFSSLYRAIKYLFSASIFYRRTFYSRGMTEVEFPFFHMKKLQGAKIQRSPWTFFPLQLLGLHSVGRFISGRFCRMCLGTREFLQPQGAIPPGLYPLRGCWVYCLAPEAPQKGECRRGRRYFWPCRTRVGFGPATGPTLKTALCHICALVGRNDIYRGLRGHSQGPLGSYIIVIAPTSPPLLVADSTFFFYGPF